MLKEGTFIVAEISANHGHDINIVKKSIARAKEIGCDAVKIQTYTADTITLQCSNEYFQIDTGTIWDGVTLYDLYKEASLPWSWHQELFDYARETGIMLFSTPFDFSAVDLLQECGNPVYKIASFEINDIPLIKYAAEKKKPMIISAGIATQDEIRAAIEACRSVGNDDIYMLKCTSQYPAKIEDANLLTMVDMKERFGVEVGLSDHTEGIEVAAAAVALGARVVEKHFIFDRKIGGPDSSFSMEPDEFAEMVARIRLVEKALGKVDYSLSEAKMASRKYARSLFVCRDVKKGDLISAENIRSIRPSDGLAPKYYEEVLGKRFSRDVSFGQPLSAEMIDGFEVSDK
ncbi:MAG: pseudaminic acid synthase [Anaerovoracaceae bacterium]|jgi:pseudaminic acid synthase